MPSPSKPSDFSNLVLTSSSTLCDRFKAALLTLPSKLYDFVNYVLDANGNPSKTFAKDLMSNTGIWSVGDIKASAGSLSSDAWLECNGEAISRTTYADLFTAIGETFGEGDDSTTFNLPDFRAHVPIGVNETSSQASGYSPIALGAQVGSESVEMKESMIAPHSHVNPEMMGFKLWHDEQQGTHLRGRRRDHFGDGRGDAGVSFVQDLFVDAGGSSDGDVEHIPIIQPSIGVRYLIYSGVHSSD